MTSSILLVLLDTVQRSLRIHLFTVQFPNFNEYCIVKSYILPEDQFLITPEIKITHGIFLRSTLCILYEFKWQETPYVSCFSDFML